MSESGEPREVPLAYATPGVKSRILYAKEGERATVVIHRPGRRAKEAAESLGKVLAQCLVYFVIGVGLVMHRGPAWVGAVVAAGAVVALLVYAAFWIGYARLDEPIVIELTPTELVFSNLDARPREQRFPREGLYAIRYAGHAKGIFVYRRGQEMYGFPAASEGPEAERIAEFLCEAAGLEAEARAG